MSTRDPTAPERQRRLRRRRKLGLSVAIVEVPPELIDDLIAARLLCEAETFDSRRIGDAVLSAARKCLKCVCRGR